MLLWAAVDVAIISFGAIAGMWAVFRRINFRMVLFILLLTYWFNLPDSWLREKLLTVETGQSIVDHTIDYAMRVAAFVRDKDAYFRKCGLTGSACSK